MSKRSMDPWLLAFYLALASLVGAIIFGYTIFAELNQEVKTLRQKEQDLRSEMAEQVKKTEEYEEYLYRLATDRQFLERVLREELLYVEKDVLIFRDSKRKQD